MDIFKLERPMNVDEAIELLNVSKSLIGQAYNALTLMELAPDKVWDTVTDYDTVVDARVRVRDALEILG